MVQHVDERSSSSPVYQRAAWNCIRTAQALLEMIVPLYFHLFFLIMLFVANIAAHLPALVGISLAMLAVSLASHGALVWRMLAARAAATSQQILPREKLGAKRE